MPSVPLPLPLVAVASALVMAAGAILAWRACGPRSAPLDPASPGRLFVLVFLATTGVGSVLITLSGEATGSGAVVAAGGLLAFGVGAWFGSSRWGRGAISTVPTRPGQFRPIGLVGLAVLGVAGYAVIAARNGIPFLTADAQATRLAFTGLAFDAFRWLVPPAALAALALALAAPSRGRWITAIAALGAVVGVMTLTASRALPLELALEGGLVAWWAGIRPSRRVWGAIGLAALVFFVGVQLLRVGGHGGFRDLPDVAQFVVTRTLDRIAMVQARTLELITVQIPDQHAYYMGATWVRWLAPLQGQAPPEALGTWLFGRLFPGEPAGGFVTPGLIGELWANGGPVAAFGGMAVFGVAVSWLGRVLGRLDATAADRVLGALLVVAVARTYATSLNGFLLTALVAVVWRVVAGRPALPAWLVPAALSSGRPSATGTSSAPGPGPDSGS
jgi:hypothetical protein